MAADIRPLNIGLAADAESARRRAMAQHPSNFKPAAPRGVKPDELEARFDCLRQELMGRGLPENEARTEVARITAREVWDGFANQLRRQRAGGEQMDANVLAVVLGSIQCMVLPLARHPGDLVSAGIAVGKARRRLQYNGSLMDRLHTHANPAFNDADVTLQSLEVFLAQPQPRVA